MTAHEIAALIQSAMPDATVQVHGDDGQHFQADVVSPAFVGLSVIAQHRLVYAALGERMGREIHALALKTRAPSQA